MIALVDIGNTRTKYVLVNETNEWGAVQTHATSTVLPDEVSKYFNKPLAKAVIGSVVPEATSAWQKFFHTLGAKVHVVNAESPFGFKIGVEEPALVGVDRLLNMEAALQFDGAVVVVDAGTATKFDLLEGGLQRTFPGGAIAPGLMISYEALLARTAQLPQIELNKHSPVVGYNTETAIRSGVLHGFAAQVDGMILRILDEKKMPAAATVISTGGNTPFLEGRARFITHHKKHFTLEGLHGIAKKI